MFENIELTAQKILWMKKYNDSIILMNQAGLSIDADWDQHTDWFVFICNCETGE